MHLNICTYLDIMYDVMNIIGIPILLHKKIGS